MSAPPLYLMAKKPVAGMVKTRLETHVDAVEAAEIAAAMIGETVRRAVEAWAGTVTLAVWPDTAHGSIEVLARDYPIALKSQCPGDLGEKMRTELASGIRDHGCAAVMGCDVPHLAPSCLTTACQRLEEGANVFGPSADGGFYLMGVHRVHERMFDGVRWGEADVASTVLASSRRVGIEFTVILPTVRDIDTWPDLEAAAGLLPWLGQYLHD